MGKLRSFFTSPKKLPEWVLPLVFLVWLFLEITEYGHRTFVEGFMDDPFNLYIVLGGFIFLVIIYFIKQKEKKKVVEEVDKSNEEDKSSENNNGSIILITIVVILVIILSYFNTKHSKETERIIEQDLKQSKMEQKDPQSQE